MASKLRETIVLGEAALGLEVVAAAALVRLTLLAVSEAVVEGPVVLVMFSKKTWGALE